MKNKYVVWGGGGLVAVALVAGSVWVWHGHTGKQSSQALYGAQSALDTTPSANKTDGQNSQTTPVSSNIPVANQPATQGSSTAQNSNGSTATNSAAGLLDPTTFAKYDTYKTAASASYIDLQAGTGATLSPGQQAAVYYRGWLTNGSLFDQSRAGSDGTLQPFPFTLGAHQVIAGWEQGLAGMKVGGVRLLIVPPAVGYGAAGQGPIPGNAVLIFQVQLAAVQ